LVTTFPRLGFGAATLAVAAAVLGTAAWPFVWPATRPELWPQTGLPDELLALYSAVGGAIALVFLLRGVAGFLPFWRAKHDAQPFAQLDQKIYSPLCLGIGTGLGVLLIN